MNIPVANPKAQCMTQKEELIDAIAKVFDTCHFILGENVTKLEETIAEVCGAKYGIAVNSGTDALVIALAACGVGPGDEVITTPYTFVATNEAAMILGAGRASKEDTIDPSAGIVLKKKPGEYVKKGDVLCHLHTSDVSKIPAAEKAFRSALSFGDKAPAAQPLIYKIIK